MENRRNFDELIYMVFLKTRYGGHFDISSWQMFNLSRMKIVQINYIICYLVSSDLVAITGVLSKKNFLETVKVGIHFQ